MSVQIFLQGKLIGIEEFLLSPVPGAAGGNTPEERLLVGRSRWIALLSEVLPRALLAELGLAKILLGSSGGGQFLVVLPGEARTQAQEFLNAVADDMEVLSAGVVQLLTAVTENLGDWSVVRKRLTEEMQRKRGTPAGSWGLDRFVPFSGSPDITPQEEYFTSVLGSALQGAETVGWPPEHPGRAVPGAGKHAWSLSSTLSPDAIPLARHTATGEDGQTPADLHTLARRAQGRPLWGILRGDVDNFGTRLRRVHTIEEHVQLSVMYKQFFAGELELLCSMPEYWRKVTILYSGGDDFAVYGSWDALIPLAREIQRLFHRFSEENLKDFPGPEGKTITMAISLASSPESSFASVYGEAGEKLGLAKSAAKDCIHVMGRTLEWRQLASAAELRETMERMAGEMEAPRQFLADLTGVYRKAAAGRQSRTSEGSFDRPWRMYRRLNHALGETRDKEVQRLRTQLTNEMLVKGITHVRLRPGGWVALEWARLSAEV